LSHTFGGFSRGFRDILPPPMSATGVLRLVLVTVALSGGACAAPGAVGRGASVVLVTIDGVRWQEIFRGADEQLLPRDPTNQNARVAREAFWRPTVSERRRTLTPFLSGTVAARGQLYGNVDGGGEMRVTNAFKISYPGYHELLCGFPSATVNSNRKAANPDATVLEWLSRRPGFAGSVAAYASWDVLAWILNRDTNHLPVNIGEPASPAGVLDRLRDEVCREQS
jgi:hypothetical protein